MTAPAFKTSPCASCRRPVIWTVTDKGKRMPVDAQPTPDGSIVLTVDKAEVRSRIVEVKFRFGRTDLHTSHFARCPAADTHRRPRGWAPGGGRR